MTAPIQVTVDLTNPGHVFACCGLAELSECLWPGITAWFSADTFFIDGTKDSDLATLIQTLYTVTFEHLDVDNNTASPIRIAEPFNLRLDWWNDIWAGGKSLKVWAGTMECTRIARAMKECLKDPRFYQSDLLNTGMVAHDVIDPKKKVEPFCFDARRAYNALSLDIGFSLNDLKMTSTAFPATELLTLIGLQRCRPQPDPDPKKSRIFTYHTWSTPLPLNVMAAAIAGTLSIAGKHSFQFENWFRTSQRKHKAFRAATPLTTGDSQ